MAASALLRIRPEHLKGAKHASDRRRYRRHDVALLGRFMRRRSKDELTCRVVDISIGGANMIADVVPEMGEEVVVYLAEFGGLDARVVRVSDDGFAISFVATHRRRQKLAAQITWLLNRHELGTADQRRPGHERIKPSIKSIRVRLPNGASQERRLLDVSISGASIATTDRPEIGCEIVVGQLMARVVRHHDHGIGVEFVELQNLTSIQRDFT